jgi:hypothetical protein
MSALIARFPYVSHMPPFVLVYNIPRSFQNIDEHSLFIVNIII